MSTPLVLFGNLLLGAVLAAAGTFPLVQALGRRIAGAAVLPLVSAGLLSGYVFGEDSYRGMGISRWDAYRSPGGALGEMFVVSVALMTACAAVLAYAGLSRRERLFRVSALAGGLTSATLVTATVIGFTAN